jgi:Protein of unknown function (DUF3551)
MRPLLVILGCFAAALCFAQPAEAQSGGWCAYYNFGGHAGYRRCGFTSLEQCVWDVRGVGGNCSHSPYYQRPHHQPYRRGYPY